MTTPIIERPLLAGSLRESPRNDFEREVLLQFRDLQRPVSATSQNISVSGMFIRSRDLQPAGSNLSFELSLDGRDQRIRGEGEVVWARLFELGAGHPAGMGIRFLDLEQESHRALLSLISGRSDPPLAASGHGSDLGEAAGQDTPELAALTYATPLSGLTSAQMSRLYAYAGYASARPGRRWSRGLRRALSLVVQAAGRVLRRRSSAVSGTRRP